jgi:hypothetical protein
VLERVRWVEPGVADPQVSYKTLLNKTPSATAPPRRLS